ncbi:MAG TPA: M23 family metallopeptidase [Candidatus Angelobacter sp.]|jgi:murein DD-endopeptidase MepM/ murein hydrolase activator NlpD
MKITGLSHHVSARVYFLLALLSFCLPCFAQAPANGPEGSWKGTLGAGAVKLRLVLTVTKTSNGEYKGILESIDQGATLPADKVTLTADKLRVDVERVHGFYEGTFNQDFSEITGSWTQNGLAQPLTFKRVESASASPAKDDDKKTASGPPSSSPADVTVPIAPTAFQADGKTHIVYELHITNFAGSKPMTLAGIEVLSDSGTSLARMEKSDLVANTLIIGNYQATGMDKLNLAPGQMANVYMWITLENSAKVPAFLEHKIAVKMGKSEDEIIARGIHVAVGRDVATISAPLRGDNWVAGNGPSNASGHRRALIPIDGHAQIAQRFAIDWVRMNADGRTFAGDPKDNKNYRAYGSEALAVADGTITEVKDGIPENIPGENSRAVPITLETIGGNHVIIDLGHSRYAFYAHLQPGSLKVKLGDHVKRGQVLGLVGNSGNSTEPHLHFHVSNGNSPLGSEGIPYALESFEAKKKAGDPLSPHKLEIPTEDEVVKFEK